MEKHPFSLLLADMPQPLPLYLSRFEAEATFAPSYVGQEDRQVIDEAFSELDALVKAGFFAWPHLGRCASAQVSVQWRDEGFTVLGAGAGLHHNVLVTVLRMIVSLHHTPLQAHRELITALGDDADALPPRCVWSELIRHVRLKGLVGADNRTIDRMDFDRFMADVQVVLPRGIEDATADCDGARLIVRGPDGSHILNRARLKVVAGSFLGVCDAGGFRSLLQLDEMPEEAAIFLRTADPGLELVIDGYHDQAYGLVDFLNVMTAGRNAMLVVSADE